MSAPDGFNLFGHLSTATGLGTAARNTASLLDRAALPFVVYDCPIVGSELDRPYGFEDRSRRLRDATPYSVNLFHVQPHFLGEMIERTWAFLPLERRINAIVPFWELSRFPDGWLAPLRFVDVVLAPSLHIQSLAEKAVPDIPVIHFPQTVTLPSDIRADRERWGFAPDETVFLLTFDVTSDISRKNPAAAVEAFRTAFPSQTDVRLVVRMKNANTDPRFSASTGDIMRASAEDPRITVLTDSLPYSDVLQLMASADVYVSLHRAEGLGLPLMESMMLGKPVIATGWSGNLDFMDAENSALVGYDLVPAAGLHDLYEDEFMGGPALWAEPRLSEAVQWMRALASGLELRARLGTVARESVQQRSASCDAEAVLRAVLALADGDLRKSARHRALTGAVWKARRGAVGRRLRRGVQTG